jgi:hypothetical protein
VEDFYYPYFIHYNEFVKQSKAVNRDITPIDKIVIYVIYSLILELLSLPTGTVYLPQQLSQAFASMLVKGDIVAFNDAITQLYKAREQLKKARAPVYDVGVPVATVASSGGRPRKMGH